MTSTIVDLLVIVLLIASLGYGYTVKRKLTILMQAIKEIEPLVQEFATAVDKSEVSVTQMRKTLSDDPEENVYEAAYEKQDQRRNEKLDRAPSPAERGRETMRTQKELVQSFFEGTRLESGA